MTEADNDKSISKLKSYSVKLFPSCEGGLLSCHYSIKILVETNTLFSTNEEMNIPIDFYSPFNLSDNSNDNYVPYNMLSSILSPSFRACCIFLYFSKWLKLKLLVTRTR